MLYQKPCKNVKK